MTQTSQPRPSDKWIPWYIVLFFAAQTVLFAWFAYIAETTHTGLVTEQAYEKGLAYNGTIKKARRQEALGFSSAIERDGRRIIFTLKDGHGRGVTGAHVRLSLFRPVHDGIDRDFDMSGGENGLYTAAIEWPEKGLWELRIHAQTQEGGYQTSKRMVLE